MMVRPSDFAPPLLADDFVEAPAHAPPERIEVGVLVVGAGPAGLACAIRFGQLLEENPQVASHLGEVPLAIVEKGKQAGSHLLSGAVVNPRSFERLFEHRPELDNLPNYGPVPAEAVYLLTRRFALRIPTPPTMRNSGNMIVSLSQLGRWLAARAEEGGAVVLAETSGERLLISEGRVAGVRTADKGRGPNGEKSANFEPGNDLVAKVTVLAEGTHGHLTGVALDHYALQPAAPQVWELGVKEIWRVPKPLPRVIHTVGWPLRYRARYREFGGSFIYPMGPNHLAIGMVVGLDYRDAALSVHDLLQELKTHPKIRALLEGAERVEWGAKTIPGGGYHSLPTRLHAPGLLLCGDAAGMVNIPGLKGVHYAVESGRLAAEAAFAQVQRPDDDQTALEDYDDAVRSGFIGSDLHQVRDIRQVFGRGFFLGGALAGLMALSKGRLSLGRLRTEPDASQLLMMTDRDRQYPVPDGELTFDKLSSVFISGNRSRDDQPGHIQIAERVPEEIAEMWVHMCPAQVYAASPKGDDGLSTVVLTPSNCVHCGAIAAKGGRFRPPEGGSGPEYTFG
jgi:electron-transferring-flavoprotein dehydrogenase